MKYIARFLMTCCLIAVSLAGQAELFDNGARANVTNRLFDYRDTALLRGVSAGTTSGEACVLHCEARSRCIGYGLREANGSSRLSTSVSGTQDEIGRSAAARQTFSSYRPPLERDAPETASTLSRWVHKGSVINVRTVPECEGLGDVEIVYNNPKGQSLDVGIRLSSILSRVSPVGALLGKAPLSSKRCDIIENDVEGLFDLRRECRSSSQRGPGGGTVCTVLQWVKIGVGTNLRSNRYEGFGRGFRTMPTRQASEHLGIGWGE